MRWGLPWFVSLVGACAAPRPGPIAATASAPHAVRELPAAPAPPTLPTEAQISEQAHALFEAYDRADEAAFAALTSPGFAMYEGGAVQERSALLEWLHVRRERGGEPFTRDWLNEQVRVSQDVAVFAGDAVEHLPAQGSRPARRLTSYNTLVFGRAGGVLRPVHWHWELSGPEGARQLWNSVFRGPREYKHQANQLLVDSVRGVKPGAALDVACGEGRNALHLATLGWKVTGVDISDVGLHLAAEQAARRKLKLELVDADIAEWDFGRARWDLVALVYAGPALTPEILHKIRDSLRPHGLLVVEGFAPAPGSRAPDATVGGRLPELFGASEGFEVLRDELVEDMPDWGWSKARLLRFVARKR